MEIWDLVVLVYLRILIILLLAGNLGPVLKISKINAVMVIFVIIRLTSVCLRVPLAVVFPWLSVKLIAFPLLMNVIALLINVTKYLRVMVLIYLIAKENVNKLLLVPQDPQDLPVLLEALEPLETTLLEHRNNKHTLVILTP